MADLDMYGERVAEASALIREFAKTEYYHYFARDYEGSLEAFIAMLDQAEEKGRQEQAARIAELEAKLAEVPRWISVADDMPGDSEICWVAILFEYSNAPTHYSVSRGYYDRGWGWRDITGGRIYTPAYWMMAPQPVAPTLPAAPASEDASNA